MKRNILVFPAALENTTNPCQFYKFPGGAPGSKKTDKQKILSFQRHSFTENTNLIALKWNTRARVPKSNMFSTGDESSKKKSFHSFNRIMGEVKPQDLVHNEETHCRVYSLVRAYRTHGHLEASLDPLGMIKPASNTLELRTGLYNLNNVLGKESDEMGDEGKFFDINGILHMGSESKPMRYAKLNQIIGHLKKVYCSDVAAQFMHLESSKEINWIAKQLEASANEVLEEEQMIHVAKLLVESELFDHFLARKFPNVKRYGLEGSESMVPAIDILLSTLSQNGVTDVVIGMPHRGRLNLLTGLLRYPPRALFHKIKGNSEFPKEIEAIGDVLSHIGISTEIKYGYGNNVAISLINNPSHLEAVNPVANGKTRAKLAQGKNAACVLMHGDAAFCAQGIVSETFSLSNLPHYSVDGTIHLIVNNQLGFTTPPKHYRSSRYSADVGKMVGAPIFSVNAEKIDAVMKVVKIAALYRQKFKKDVIVELVGYRKHGHNELDEPSFTQPKMYSTIRNKETFPHAYTHELTRKKILDQDVLKRMTLERENFLENEWKQSANYEPEKFFFLGDWKGINFASDVSIPEEPKTGISMQILNDIALQSVHIPENFTVHQRLKKYHIEKRKQAILQGDPIDWATAEAIAIGSLLLDGYNIRLSGQDVARGTFSQRHFEFIDQESEDRYIPLFNLSGRKGSFELVTSPLSELAVLGYEYGYSINNPKNLCIWEAQFGDFANGAQIIIDQFISSGEDKWCLSSGLVMLLPHGMDGAGPEHSSGRIERFLQLCNGDINTPEKVQRKVNMYVIYPSTPANYFHALRRQMLRKYRKPLVVMSPKVLLRKAEAVSKLFEFSEESGFHSILPDTVKASKEIKRIMICSGKIYYDLAHYRSAHGLEEKVAIIRLEELCPFPFKELEAELNKYLSQLGEKKPQFYYVQEEHENQGAYTYVSPRIQKIIGRDNILQYVGRKSCSASAVGVANIHKVECEKLMKDAFDGLL